MDQKTAAYRDDRKSKYHFYLKLFFDLLDVTLVNSHIVYTKLVNSISLLNFKIVAAKALIGRNSNRNRSLPTSRPGKTKSYEPSMPREVADHVLALQEKRMEMLLLQE